jgi:DHA1 family bicyclomycin/chloramphenicol resistance-like MFS transporter
MLTGAAIIALVSRFFDGTALPMVTTIALCALAAFTLSWFTLHPEKMVAKPAE